MSTELSKHSILWPEDEWSTSFWSNELMSHPILSVEVETPIHDAIIKSMGGIPIPEESCCKSAYGEIQELCDFGSLKDDTFIDIRVSVLICIFEYIAQETADALKEQLGIIRDMR